LASGGDKKFILLSRIQIDHFGVSFFFDKLAAPFIKMRTTLNGVFGLLGWTSFS